MENAEIVVELRNVKKIYRMGDERITAVNDATLNFERGKIYCLLGKSGSGKSTLLNLIAGLEKPTKGSIIFNNKSIEKMTEKQLAIFRQKYIGFVFQSYNLLPTLTALENVTLPLIFRRFSKRKRNKLALEMLRNVDLEDRYKHKPSQMSGGQQQRVSIARAFVNDPQVVFADEPTGNLDTKTANEMMALITTIASRNKQTLIIVTHNLELARFADIIINIRDGTIESLTDNSSGKISEEELSALYSERFNKKASGENNPKKQKKKKKAAKNKKADSNAPPVAEPIPPGPEAS